MNVDLYLCLTRLGRKHMKVWLRIKIKPEEILKMTETELSEPELAEDREQNDSGHTSEEVCGPGLKQIQKTSGSSWGLPTQQIVS